MNETKVKVYVIFSFLGGTLSLGATMIATSINPYGYVGAHIWGGMLATFLGYTIESWMDEVEE